MPYIDILEPCFSQFQGTIKIHLNRGERKSNSWKSFMIFLWSKGFELFT